MNKGPKMLRFSQFYFFLREVKYTFIQYFPGQICKNLQLYDQYCVIVQAYIKCMQNLKTFLLLLLSSIDFVAISFRFFCNTCSTYCTLLHCLYCNTIRQFKRVWGILLFIQYFLGTICKKLQLHDQYCVIVQAQIKVCKILKFFVVVVVQY